MKKSGVAFHVHHDRLIEYCHDYDERVAFIKQYKPQEEQKLRQRLFQIIPDDRLPQKGLKAHIKARKTHDKAWEAYTKAWEAHYKAREAHYKAREAYMRKNRDAIEKLHTELCPDCPWDGETILGQKEGG